MNFIKFQKKNSKYEIQFQLKNETQPKEFHWWFLFLSMSWYSEEGEEMTPQKDISYKPSIMNEVHQKLYIGCEEAEKVKKKKNFLC